MPNHIVEIGEGNRLLLNATELRKRFPNIFKNMSEEEMREFTQDIMTKVLAGFIGEEE